MQHKADSTLNKSNHFQVVSEFKWNPNTHEIDKEVRFVTEDDLRWIRSNPQQLPNVNELNVEEKQAEIQQVCSIHNLSQMF